MEQSGENEFLLFRNRLRRFSEKLIKDETEVYKTLGIDVPIRYIRVLRILDENQQPLSITEIAKAIDRTHPDIHYITLGLFKDGLIRNIKDRRDHRRRLVTLSTKGKELVNQIRPIWQATIDATAEWLHHLAPEFLIYLNSLEQSLSQESYFEKIQHKLLENYEEQIDISTFKKLQREEEYILNFYRQWSQEYYPITELETLLMNIKTNIINRGGEVFFASIEDHCQGLAVLQRLSFDKIQLVFIYVNPAYRGKHIANKLMKSAIQFSQKIGCKQIICHSNRVLVPADSLLRKFDFEKSSLVQKNYMPYEHLPITMVLNMKK